MHEWKGGARRAPGPEWTVFWVGTALLGGTAPSEKPGWGCTGRRPHAPAGGIRSSATTRDRVDNLQRRCGPLWTRNRHGAIVEMRVAGARTGPVSQVPLPGSGLEPG